MAAVRDIITEQGTEELLEECGEEALGAAVPVGESDGLQLGHQRTKFPFLSRRTAFLAGAGFFALALVAALAAWRSGEAGSAGAQGMSQWDPDDQAIMVKMLEEQSGRSLAEDEKQALKVVVPHAGITTLLSFFIKKTTKTTKGFTVDFLRKRDFTDECMNAVTDHMEHHLQKGSDIIMKALVACRHGEQTSGQTPKCETALKKLKNYKKVIIKQCNEDPDFDLCSAESEVHMKGASSNITNSELVCLPDECQDEHNMKVLEKRFGAKVCRPLRDGYDSCSVDVYCGSAYSGSI